MSKRTANSPPEAEKSKDSMDKPTPITPPPPNFLSSYAQRLNAAEGSDMAREKRWHIPMTDREKHAKWDLVYSRRKKQHSTGRTPDNSPSKTISPQVVLLESNVEMPGEMPLAPTLTSTTSTPNQSSTLVTRDRSVMR